MVCGVRVEDIQDPTMREIRYLDKLIDELAREKQWRRFCGSKFVSWISQNPLNHNLHLENTAEFHTSGAYHPDDFAGGFVRRFLFFKPPLPHSKIFFFSILTCFVYNCFCNIEKCSFKFNKLPIKRIKKNEHDFH